MVEELRKKNDELSLWVTSLRLYQEIFENETSAMLGLNRDGEIILFNKSALELFGETLQGMVMHGVDELNFSSIDPGIPQLVKKVIGRQERVQTNTKIGNKCISTLGIPLKSNTEFRGLLLKINVTNKK